MFALLLPVGRNYGIIRGMDGLKKIMYGVTVLRDSAEMTFRRLSLQKVTIVDLSMVIMV